ncbi:MAG: Mrp/NBP35 family ATP-binding protein [Haloferacaceae archaeon]
MDSDEVRSLLADIEDPALGDDIVSLGLVNEVSVDGDTARVSLGLGAPFAPDESRIADRVREALEAEGLAVELAAGIARETPREDRMLPDVKNIVAVASGKGGVGKSTVAVNLAAGLADRGARVGLFDSDIYGPNVPRMLAPEDAPRVTEDRTVPPEKYGVKLISMDFFLDDDDPVVWRGPMVQKTLTQLWEDVVWDTLDYLVVDLPPGTGDAQLSLLQSLPVTGAVIVTTPQQVAVDDADKGLRMFDQFDTPVLGIVENMASYRCPSCGDEHDILGSGGGERLARENDVPLLGSIPMDRSVQMGDDGSPPAVLQPDSAAADAFDEVVDNAADRVGAVVRRRHAEVVGAVEPDADAGSGSGSGPTDAGEPDGTDAGAGDADPTRTPPGGD